MSKFTKGQQLRIIDDGHPSEGKTGVCLGYNDNGMCKVQKGDMSCSWFNVHEKDLELAVDLDVEIYRLRKRIEDLEGERDFTHGSE